MNKVELVVVKEKVAEFIGILNNLEINYTTEYSGNNVKIVMNLSDEQYSALSASITAANFKGIAMATVNGVAIAANALLNGTIKTAEIIGTKLIAPAAKQTVRLATSGVRVATETATIGIAGAFNATVKNSKEAIENIKENQECQEAKATLVSAANSIAGFFGKKISNGIVSFTKL